MKRQLILSAMLVATAGAMACTNFIVGKKASVDGSVICSYSADSYGMFQGLKHQPAAKHPKGTMRQVYDWDTNKYGGEILEAADADEQVLFGGGGQGAQRERRDGGAEELSAHGNESFRSGF